MIVAHPDNKTCCGGGHLLQGKYLVVCLTNGYNTIRSSEFRKATAVSGLQCLIMNYPDTNAEEERDDWFGYSRGIANDVHTLLIAKKWKRIVVHRSNGDTGHAHHKAPDRMVAKQCRKVSYEYDQRCFLERRTRSARPSLRSLSPIS